MSRLDQLRKLRDADPSDPDVPYMIAQEHARDGRADDAIDAFDECLTLDPGYHYAYFHKARALESAGRRDDARRTLRAGLARAQADRAAKAAGELSEYLNQLGG